MAGPNLPVNVDTTYADDAADASVKLHQQNHDTLHTFANMFDLGLLAGGTTGQVVAKNSAGQYAPSTPTGSSGMPWRICQPGDDIQGALNAGPGVVLLAPGTHNVSAPIQMKPKTWLLGSGAATHLKATAAIDSVISVGNGGPIDRWCISDLVVDAENLATSGIHVNIVGTTGNDKGEPDSQGRIDNLYVNDGQTNGILYEGTDAQAIITTRVRVRRAGLYGYNIICPDSWWDQCEATTVNNGGAGFFVQGANLHFNQCKAWFCRGYGWWIKGTRNIFVGCESQDTQSHGWNVEFDKNTFSGCMADTPGMSDVGGVPGTADGFFFAAMAATTFVGGLAFDRQPGGVAKSMRYGFNFANSWYTQTPAPVAGLAGFGYLTALLNLR